MAAAAYVAGASTGERTVGRVADGVAGPGAYPVPVRVADVPGEPLMDSVAARRGPPLGAPGVQGPTAPGAGSRGRDRKDFPLDGGLLALFGGCVGAATSGG